ncbi:Mor transcription activator family protein [Pseudazoarcus pumilus]|uniref:Mor transcription activator domain-containing protein n=1 Tax=Pseudazoarcus pumilus TaxID=2067960 RepID=A0A2I6S822_9RHOO|nr:Mor transcription activator family protein [Pseudazoarcus pumilus]AUN95413.1 hypothetical protein C0099_11030 [Pseudazoarcus pumilus]
MTPSIAPELTEDIPTIVAEELAAAQRAGIPSSDQPGYVADRLRFRISGSHQYVRKTRTSPAERRAAILRDFNGRNLAELADEHDLSERRVRQILAEGRK